MRKPNFIYIKIGSLLPRIGLKTHVETFKQRLLRCPPYNNRYALKCAFGEEYNELYPGTIYSPPSSYFSSTVG